MQTVLQCMRGFYSFLFIRKILVCQLYPIQSQGFVFVQCMTKEVHLCFYLEITNFPNLNLTCCVIFIHQAQNLCCISL